MRQFYKLYLMKFSTAIGINQLIRKNLFRFLSLWWSVSNLWAKYLCVSVPIVLYHRIDEVMFDPHFHCVKPETFREHIAFYVENYDVISLSEYIVRRKDMRLNGSELVITFDDGYRDNLINALPILNEFGVCATIFITTASLGERASFPWDMQYEKSDRAVFLSQEELQVLANHPLIEIGAHTITHQRLGDLSEHDQRSEIVRSVEKIEKIIGKKVDYFAYPFGGIFDFTKETQKIVGESDFIAGLANIPKYAVYRSSIFALPRFNIREYTVPELRKLLLI